MTDATVHIIPLYTFSIKREFKRGDSYDNIIIADSIDKIAEGIADLELQHEESFEDNWKYFRIEDFIVLPKEEGQHGKHKFCLYRLSDDLTFGYGGDDDVYDVYIKGELPEAVPDFREYELSKNPIAVDEMFKILYAGNYVADVIYAFSLSSPIRAKKVDEWNEQEGKELAMATAFVAKLKTIENSLSPK